MLATPQKLLSFYLPVSGAPAKGLVDTTLLHAQNSCSLLLCWQGFHLSVLPFPEGSLCGFCGKDTHLDSSAGQGKSFFLGCLRHFFALVKP